MEKPKKRLLVLIYEAIKDTDEAYIDPWSRPSTKL